MKHNHILKTSMLLLVLMLTTISTQAAVVNITISKDTCQRVTGFGAAALGGLMMPITDVDIIDKAYGADSPIGLNILRMEVAPNTVGDVVSGSWDPQNDWKGYVPAVKKARSKGALILGTPWSPPAIYKTNNSSSGGKNESDPTQSVRGELNSNGYKMFFSWLRQFANYMKNQGAPVDVVSIQNEPDWWVDYSGCLYTPEQVHDLVANYAYRFSKSDGIRLMSSEPLGFNPAYTDALLDDPVTRDYIDMIGGHIYGTDPLKEMKTSCDKATKYGKETWMTEHIVHPASEDQGIRDLPTWHDEMNFANELNECMMAGINGYVYWYLARYYSLIGDGESVPSGGNTYGEILPRGYIMSHFAKHLPGAYRVSSTTNLTKNTGPFEQTAYMKGDSIIVIAIDTLGRSLDLQLNLPYEVKSGKVISSTSASSLCQEAELDIQSPTKTMTYTVSPRSVNTFIFTTANPTGIEELKANADKAITRPRSGIYTLQGARVKTMKPGGVYIVDGKKTFF